MAEDEKKMIDQDAIDRERWSRVGMLFAEAITMTQEERADFLDEACSDDTSMRRELESLLAAHAKLGADFLDELDQESVDDLLDSIPEHIGPWKIEEEIGRGGMGVVYRALRDDGQFEQQVALKLIKRGMDSDQIQQRFLHERQILAGLQHPGIARLLDGGVTAAGRPYFALEFVEGVTLSRYCEQQELDLDARLRLFAEVCEAVEYAHRNLVVHRDLKPSNILVDQSGRVKLLDFGIATLLDDESPGETRTAAEGRLVTPGYGAPELVLGGRITTATDVYSLGIILYELLSGQLPYEFDKGPLAAMALAMSDSRPPRLSDLASASAPNPPRRLVGELDTIAAKAIQSAPDRRYVSAAALREDIERYLSGEPVLACPDSLGYRFGKWVRRHRTLVAAATLVALSIVGGLGAALWQAGIAAEERDHARREAAQTEEVKDFIIELFRTTDPRELKGAELTAERLLDRGLERVRSGLEYRPDLRLELLAAIAEAAKLLGDFDKAEDIFQEALEIDVGPEPHAQLRLAAAISGLGENFAFRKENERAAQQHRRALALRLEHAGRDSVETAQSYNNLGVALADQGQLDEAIEVYVEALRIQEKVKGETDPETLNTLGNLGTAHRLNGDYRGAEAQLRLVIERMRRREGDDHPYMIWYQSQLASILRRLGEFQEAEQLWGRSLELSRQIWGESHPTTGDMINNYAVISHILGNDAEAVRLMRENMELNIEHFGPEHPYVPASQHNLAGMLLDLGEIDEALELLETATALHIKVSPPHYLVYCDLKHAQALLVAGRPAEARQLADRALEAERSQESPNGSRLVRALTVSGSVYREQRRFPEAVAAFEEALALHGQLGSDGSLTAGAAHMELGLVRLAQGRLAEAQKALERADEIWSKSLPEGHWRRAELLVALGEYWIVEGSREKGRQLMDEGIRQLESERSQQHWRVQRAMQKREILERAEVVDA